MSRVLIAGSGRMGRDLGLWLLRQGHQVHWVSRHPSRLEALRAQVERVLRRWQREGSAAGAAAAVTFGTPASLASLDVPDLMIEAVEEEAAAKRAVLAWADVWAPRQPLLLSTTSSFLPRHLHPRCVVTHFFFPVELTGIVEVVWPSAVTGHDRERLHELLRPSRVYVIEQTDRQAFAVNRLLLPAHAECVRLVRLGLAPALADQAAATGLLGVAPLALAQRVGLTTMRAALANYVAVATGAEDYHELVQALAEDGDPAPTAAAMGAGLSLADASDVQQAVQLNTCLRFVQEDLISEPDLDWLLPNFYGRASTLATALEPCDRQRLAARLRTLHRQTGRQYFEPAESLKAT
jgi:3-hydroxyacyl-CoA dehydrogenase